MHILTDDRIVLVCFTIMVGLSDRIHVIYEGEFVKEINPQDATPELLGGYMTGLKS